LGSDCVPYSQGAFLTTWTAGKRKRGRGDTKKKRKRGKRKKRREQKKKRVGAPKCVRQPEGKGKKQKYERKKESKSNLISSPLG